MLYWLIYDISNNGTRKKVSDKCKDYGMFRIQKSAFIGELTANKSEMLMEELQSITGEGFSDCVFLIPTCKDCFKSREIIGYFNEEALEKKELVFLSSC